MTMLGPIILGVGVVAGVLVLVAVATLGRSSDAGSGPPVTPEAARSGAGDEDETPAGLERYVDLEILHEGSSVVFRGWDRVDLRHVALRRDRAYSRREARRLERESLVLTRIEGPHVLAIHEVFAEREDVYFVMDCLSGRTLADRIAEGVPELRESVRIVAQIAAGLDRMHGEGVLHRDLRPRRILIDESGDCRVAMEPRVPGGCLAQATTYSCIRLPTEYCSPESAQGVSGEDRRANVYSLGVVLFELLTGRLPFESDDPIEILHDHVNEPPPRPSDRNPAVASSIDDVVLRALAKDPAARYPTAGDLARALSEAAGEPRARVPTLGA